MSRHAKAYSDDMERRMNEPASPEDMERRRKLLSELSALWNRPVTEDEKEFWKKFDEGFEQERLTFR